MTVGLSTDRKPKLRAVVFGAGRGFLPPLLEKFEQEYEVVEVISHIGKPPMIIKLLFLVLSFRLPKQAWYRRWMHYMEKTPFAFKTYTARNAERLERLSGKYDIIIKFGAMSAPTFYLDKPLFIITDSTRCLSSRNAHDVLSHFDNAREKQGWLALEGNVYRAARRLFVGSNFVKNSLVSDYGVSPERVIVTGFGAGIGHAEKYEKHFDGRSILFIGKGDFEKKGGKLLLKAFAEVRKDIPDAVLHIVGQERVPQSEGVINHGFVTDRILLRDLLKAAHVFVLPSLVDRFGIVLGEARAAATPCIASDYGALPEVVGTAGIIVRQNDVRELAEAMKKILRDERLARELGENGRRRFEEKYNWTRVWETMRSEINKALDEEARETVIDMFSGA